jgi:hypothetical protein
MKWLNVLGGVAAQASFVANYAPNRPTPFVKHRTEANAGFSFARAFGLGLYARRAWGYDYYNLAYGYRSDSRVALAIHFDRAVSSRRFSFGDNPPDK